VSFSLSGKSAVQASLLPPHLGQGSFLSIPFICCNVSIRKFPPPWTNFLGSPSPCFFPAPGPSGPGLPFFAGSLFWPFFSFCANRQWSPALSPSALVGDSSPFSIRVVFEQAYCFLPFSQGGSRSTRPQHDFVEAPPFVLPVISFFF